MGLLIRAKKVKSLNVRKVTPKEGTAFTLEELQEFVGGNIEPVRLSSFLVGQKVRSYRIKPDTIMLVNEESTILNLPLNVVATSLTGHLILGDVVLVEQGTEFV